MQMCGERKRRVKRRRRRGKLGKELKVRTVIFGGSAAKEDEGPQGLEGGKAREIPSTLAMEGVREARWFRRKRHQKK